MKERRRHPTKTMEVKAPIDVLVAPLVCAVGRYPEALTMYSCQGEPSGEDKDWNWHSDTAFVIFRVGNGTALELAAFLDFLSDHIGTLGVYVHISIHLSSNGACQIELRVQQENIGRCASWLDRIRRCWRGLVMEMRDRCIVSHRALVHCQPSFSGAQAAVPK